MEKNFATPGLPWILLSVACVAVILYGLSKTLQRTGWEQQRQKKVLLISGMLMVAWGLLLSTLALKGFFADFSKMPPRPALAILLPLPVILFISFSKVGTHLLKSVPAHWLVIVQTFRIVVELMLLMAFRANMLPAQMTFEGRNFDILSGILAIPAAYLLLKQNNKAKAIGIAYNITGMLLLLNILIVAVLSMPTPYRYFMNEPSNTLVAQFPFILLPGILVPIAYSFHIFSLRQLLKK